MKTDPLIAKCKENSYDAQMEVYKRYRDYLYNACWRLFRNKYDTEDAVHEAFIKGFKNMHQLKENTNLGGWLKRIAVNHCIDELRKRNRFYLESIEDAEFEDYPEEVERIPIQLIKRCMGMLDDKYRIIVTLYMVENYTHKEISEQLEIKESTVRNQYIRGKKKLLQLIKQNSHDEFEELRSTKP